MLLYNQLTELTLSQFLLFALYEVLVTSVLLRVFKLKITANIILFSVIAAILLSLLSTIIVNEGQCCAVYFESFGWPFQYRGVSWDMFEMEGHVPADFRFDTIRFIANTLYWGFVPFILLLYRHNKKKNNKIRLFFIATILIFAAGTAGLSYYNFIASQPKTEETIPSTVAPIDMEPTLLDKKKQAIEASYPEFQNFKNLDKLPPQDIQIHKGEPYDYFAYLVYGSGVPIIQATCFKVDNDFKVTKIGEFPALRNSHLNYTDVDPVTCKGIE